MGGHGGVQERGRKEDSQGQRRNYGGLSCGHCAKFCGTAQQLWRHVEQRWEDGGTCLQEMGHPDLASLKLHIRNMRRRAKVHIFNIYILFCFVRFLDFISI